MDRAEYDTLTTRYKQYKEELAEHEKKAYAYEERLTEYGKAVQESIGALTSAGISLNTLNNLPNGELDLKNTETLKAVLDELYCLYKTEVSKAENILNSR